MAHTEQQDKNGKQPVFVIPMKNVDGKSSEEDTPDVRDADFETAITATEFGKYNILLLLIALPAAMTSIFDSTAVSYILPAAECDLHLNLHDKGYLNSITYIGMLSSAFVWGFLSDTLGRKKLLVIGYFLDSFFVVLCGLSQSFTMLLISKFMTGFIITGPHSVLATYICEFHSSKYRPRVIIYLSILYFGATVVIPLLAWAILPRTIEIGSAQQSFVLHSWNVYLFACAIPSLISGSLFLKMPESPKFLMTMGKNERAMRIFKNIYNVNTGNAVDTYTIKTLVEEAELRKKDPKKHGAQITANRTKMQAIKEGWKQMIPLFMPPHIFSVVIVCTLQFSIFIGINSLRLWLPQIYTAISDYKIAFVNEEDSSLCSMLEYMKYRNSAVNQTASNSSSCFTNYGDSSVYTNNLIVSGISLPVCLFIGYIINRVGRKRILSSLGVFGGICGFCLYFSRNTATTTALSSAYVALSGLFPDMMAGIVIDIFPTSLRTMSLCLTMMFGRLGSVVGTVLLPILLESGCFATFLILGIIVCGCGCLIWALPNPDKKALI